MTTFKVYSVSEICYEDPRKNFVNFRYFSTKSRAIEIYSHLGFVLCESNISDHQLSQTRMYNSKENVFVYIKECEVE